MKKTLMYLLMCCLSFSFILGSASAKGEVRKEEGAFVKQTVTNEYDSFKKLQKKSVDELKSMGYSVDQIQYIHGFDFKTELSNKVLELQTKDYSVLKNLGYHDRQIEIINNYEGTENQVAMLAASVTLSAFFGSHTKSASYTAVNSVTMFSWDSEPIFLLDDIVAVPWTEGFYLDTSTSTAQITYVKVSDGSIYTTGYPTITPSLNMGASIKFDMGYPISGSDRVYAKAGVLGLRIHKQDLVEEVAIQPRWTYNISNR